MALIKCPECGKEISDRVVSCPHCGYPLQEDVDTSNRRMLADRAFENNQFAEAQRLYSELLLTSPGDQELQYLKETATVMQVNPDTLDARPWISSISAYLSSAQNAMDVKKRVARDGMNFIARGLNISANKYNQLAQTQRTTALRNLFVRPVWNQDYNAYNSFETYLPQYINYMWALASTCGEVVKILNITSTDTAHDSTLKSDYGGFLANGLVCCNNLIAQKNKVAPNYRSQVANYKQDFEARQRRL